jgi:ubiquinone/menaquinone biosynthesis C-methylase UbiE
VFDRAPAAFGDCSALEAIDRLVDVAGLDLVDVGCGAGELARALVDRGARVVAIEPDDVQARRNADAPALPGLTFRRATAQALPLPPASADGVFFSKSLHHVPIDAMDRALGEARRVLREDGFLCVLEPDIDGAFSELMRPFHDETEVRRAALAALERSAVPAFADMRRAAFTVTRRYDDFEAFVVATTGLSYNTTERGKVETADVRSRFESGFDGRGYSFAQPMSAYLFSGRARHA